MARKRDKRPPLAVGHICLEVNNIAEAADWFVDIGMRTIFKGDSVAVLELRGGTHLVLQPTRRRSRASRPAPFDLMVDDIDDVHAAWRAKGLKAGRIGRGRIP